MQLLVTGGCGFIGSNFIHYILNAHPDWHVTNLDLLTYAGRKENLADLGDSSNYAFIQGDIADSELVQEHVKGKDAAINFAAESHVDRSIENAKPFLHTNVLGTGSVLEACRKNSVHVLHLSTDEVYGSRKEGAFKEEDTLNPSSPYSASKAAADHLCQAYVTTYGLSCSLVRPSNNYGPYQFPEKFIPVAVLAALKDKSIPVYGEGLNVRDWLYVEDNCAAIETVLLKGGRKGDIYNVCGSFAPTNIELAKKILKLLDKPESLIEFVKDRPGHDFRYDVDASKLHGLGWKPKHNFEEAFAKTVQWYKENEAWWKPLLKEQGGN